MKIELKRKKEIARKTSMKEKGITLIALIVTIIVLLLLAGVTISMVTGNNGIFGKAKLAGKKYSDSAKNEEEQLEEFKQMADELSSEESKLPDNA